MARMEQDKSAFKILTGKPIGKRALGRPRRRLGINLTMDLKEIRDIWVDSDQYKDYWRAFLNGAFHKPWSYLQLSRRTVMSL